MHCEDMDKQKANNFLDEQKEQSSVNNQRLNQGLLPITDQIPIQYLSYMQDHPEESYALEWFENNVGGNANKDSNREYYIKYVEDESFRNFVKSLVAIASNAKTGPVKRENIRTFEE